MKQLAAMLDLRAGGTAVLSLVAALLSNMAVAQVPGAYGLADDLAPAGSSDALAGTRVAPNEVPLGIHLGNLTAQPEASVTAGYDDNVLGARRARGSAFNQTQAVLQARSDWSRNSISARFSVDDLRYLDQPRQSHTDFTAMVDGRYQIGRDTASLQYEHKTLSQTPRDLNVPQLDQPIAYRVDDIRFAYDARFNQLTLRPNLDVTAFSYDDGSVAGQPYLQAYRNRTTLTPGILLTYELAPQRYLVGLISNGVAAFRKPLPGALLLDYNDMLALSGIDYDGGGLFRIRALAGYEARSFSSPLLKSIQAPVAELTLIYRPTKLTTVTGTLSRRITDSADETVTGVTKTAARLAVRHELLRDVVLNGTGEIALEQYGRGQGEQTLLRAGADATWLINRHAQLTATYVFQARQSHLTALLGSAAQPGLQPSGGSFDSNRFGLQVGFRL